MNNHQRNKTQRNTLGNQRIKILLITFLVISLFIAGCGQGNPRRPQVLNVYTGTQGVTIQLTQNNPPAQMYEGSEVVLMAEIWNRGAFTPLERKEGPIPDSPIYVSVNVDNIYFNVTGGLGYDDDNFNRANRDYSGSLMSLYLSGKSEAWPIGEKTIMPIATLKVNPIPGTREAPTTKVDVSACYQYKTYFSENICVDTDIYNIDTAPICKNLRTYTYAGQGAPLIISKLEVDMIPIGITADMQPSSVPIVASDGQLENIGSGQTAGKSIIISPSFRIYFTNTDKGVVLNTKYFDNNYGNNPCVTGASQEGRALRITAHLADRELTCTDTELKLYSNEGSVRCWLPKEDIPPEYTLNRNFELPLKIEAEYFYRTTTTKDVKIVRVI